MLWTRLRISAAILISAAVTTACPGVQPDAESPLRAGPPFTQVEHKATVQVVAWAPDGKRLATGASDGTITIIDPATGKKVSDFSINTGIFAIAFSPDGKKIIVGKDGPGKQVGVWDVEGARELLVFSAQGPGGFNAGAQKVTFTPDGQGSIMIGVGIFMYRTPNASGGFATGLKGGVGGSGAVAPDGTVIGWCDGQGQVSWCKTDQFGGNAGIRIGSNMFQPLPAGKCTCIAFGPGAKLLATGGDGKDVQLWDLAANKKSAVLRGRDKPAASMAFSADGKTLAAVSGDGATISVWDVTRNALRCQINHNRGTAISMALSPDGKTVATVSKDSKVLLLWKANARELNHKGPALELSANEMAALWSDLADAAFDKADAAFLKLGAAGDNAVAFLAKQIRAVAVPEVDNKRIEKLIAELDADKFATREGAMAELTALGELAVVPLQRLLEKSSSAEAKQRATMILKKVGEAALTPDRLRVLDAIDLLEQLHTAKAVGVIQETEREARIPQIRTAAQQALQRLERLQQEKK